MLDKGLIWIATGMNHHIIDEITVKEHEWHRRINLKSTYAPVFTELEMNKKRWREAAQKEMTLCDWLGKYVHNKQ